MNIRGDIAMMPEEKVCYCGDGTPHWHAYQAIFDGNRWVPITSQVGIDVAASETKAAMGAKDGN